MKTLTVTLAATFILAVAGPACAAPGPVALVPSGVLLAQNSDDKVPPPANSGGAGDKAAASKEAQKEKAPAKKRGESHTQERARQIQDFNRAKRVR